MASLTDRQGRFTFDSPRSQGEIDLWHLGATSIIHNADGSFAGVYVDNEEPNRNNKALAFRKQLPASCVVIVGLYPSEPHVHIPGCLCAYEWYPFHKGWGMPKRGPEAFILQWHFAWPGDRPPTARERWGLYLYVRARLRPKLILLY